MAAREDGQAWDPNKLKGPATKKQLETLDKLEVKYRLPITKRWASILITRKIEWVKERIRERKVVQKYRAHQIRRFLGPIEDHVDMPASYYNDWD